MRIVGQPQGLAERECLGELVEEKPFVDFPVFEAQQFHGDAFRFAETGAQDAAMVICDGDGIASLQSLGAMLNGTRENPGMETEHGAFFALEQTDDRVEGSFVHGNSVFAKIRN